MPAESKKQQRFFGMVHAVQKGELSPSKVGPAVRKAAKNTEYSDAEDFASTKHKNLPEKKGSLQMKYFEKQSGLLGMAKKLPKGSGLGVSASKPLKHAKKIGPIFKETAQSKRFGDWTGKGLVEGKIQRPAL